MRFLCLIIISKLSAVPRGWLIVLFPTDAILTTIQPVCFRFRCFPSGETKRKLPVASDESYIFKSLGNQVNLCTRGNFTDLYWWKFLLCEVMFTARILLRSSSVARAHADRMRKRMNSKGEKKMHLIRQPRNFQRSFDCIIVRLSEFRTDQEIHKIICMI